MQDNPNARLTVGDSFSWKYAGHLHTTHTHTHYVVDANHLLKHTAFVHQIQGEVRK
jgi:hypothetical protein